MGKAIYHCPSCQQDFLLRLDPCPGCVDRAHEKVRTRKARERRAAYDPVGQIEERQFWDLLRLYSCCPCCRRNWAVVGGIARDHIVPVSRSGPNEMRNIQPLCQECNLWKSDQIIYFDRYFPGRCAPLPEHLRVYLPTDLQDAQLSLLACPAIDPSLGFPNASPRQLEMVTLYLSRPSS